jgi:AcrR family transcriptional regulator
MRGTPEPQQPDRAESLGRILESAEKEFSEFGFEGAGMKSIAARAGVSGALIHYHFGSKDALYEEVIRSRSRKINDARLALLAKVDPDGPDPLRDVLEALLRPALGVEGGGKAYARIYAGLMVGRPHDQALVRECYDPTARRFIDAIALARPGLGKARAGMVYQMALGVLASVISRDGRLERLMGREEAPLGEEALVAAITEFVAGGSDAVSEPP